MKTLLRISVIIVLMILGISTTYGQNEFSRTIEKSCPTIVKAIIIESSYSSVTITEWDKSEISMTSQIITKGATDQIAKEINKCIDVKFLPNLTDGTRIKTEINHDKIRTISSKMTDYKINIAIKAPRSLIATISNRYGSVAINVPLRSLMAESKYGNLSVDQVTERANVVSKYGNVGINKVDDLNLEIKYGNAKIDDVNKLNGLVGYGAIDIERVTDAQFSDIGYSHCKIGQYERSLNVESLRYGSIVATGSDSFTSAIVDAAYSPVTLNFSGNVMFNCDISVSYGGVDFRGIGFSGTAPTNSPNRHVGVCGKNCDQNTFKQTGKQVTVINRYSTVALVKK